MTDIKNKKRYRSLRIFIVFLIGIGILFAAISLSNRWAKNKKITQPSPQKPTSTSVEVSPIHREDHAVIINSTGFVKAKQQIKLSTEVGGKVIYLSPNLQVGKNVRKDDILIKIDATQYQAKVSQALASLSQAKSQYEIEKAKGESAKFSNQQFGIKNTPLSLRKPQINAAKAQLNNAEAQFKLSQSNLKKTIIKAPFNGLVISKAVQVNEFANLGQTLTEIASSDAYTIELNISSLQLPFIRLNNSVSLTDTLSGHSFLGSINRISPMLNKENRTVKLFVETNPKINNQHTLLINSFIKAKIKGTQIKNSSWISSQSIVDNQFIWSVTDVKTLQKNPIQIIHTQANKALVVIPKSISHFVTDPKDSFFVGQSFDQVFQQSTTDTH